MKKSSLTIALASVMAGIGSLLSTRNDHTTRSVRVMGYKGIGGRPFTRGKRSKSLKVRANRRKAKAKARS